MIILQIAPTIEVGTGVGAVAYHLEQEWRRLGHEPRRLELRDTGAGWLPQPGPGLRGKFAVAARVVWFSTVGTVIARREIARLPPGSVSICHNDALAGDIYVNHGVLQTSLTARGHKRLRMLRNPLHLFIAVRDRLRYEAGLHQVVINLTTVDDQALKGVYSGLRSPTWVIGNGVDLDRFRPPTAAERQAARERVGATDGDLVTLFVGHEYARKGLFPLLEAMRRMDQHHHLVVVGGDAHMVADLRERAVRAGCAARVHAVGAEDPRSFLWAADALAQPSAYESYGLVVTEALASGVPVISTPVGVAPDVVRPGRTGFLTDGSAEDLVRQLRRLEGADLPAMRSGCREMALAHSWAQIARTYLDHVDQLGRRPSQSRVS